MFVFAYPEDVQHIFYFDTAGNKYLARGGTLAWRINNPGLIQSRNRVAKKNGSIGNCCGYAIFPNPEQGRHALGDWLLLKKYFNSTLKTIGKHYQPENPEAFVSRLVALNDLPTNQKIKDFPKQDFEVLRKAIEKVCLFVAQGSEEFFLLPKIDGKIENKPGNEDLYLVGGDIILTKTETIAWIKSYRLDAAVVHEPNGHIHLRSRPHHSFWHVKIQSLTKSELPQEEPISTIARTVGQNKSMQCIWGFINGMSNNRKRALHSAEIISEVAGGEAVISLPNDTQYVVDVLAILAQKGSIDTPTIFLAARFFHYLLALQEKNPNKPIVIFAYSQGAIICERALQLLKLPEREKLRIFSLGGGSFIAPGQSHPESHNYASAADLVCRLGSPNLQILALEKYAAQKKGISNEELLRNLAMRDALLQIDSLNSTLVQKYAEQRRQHYEKEFEKIRSVM